MLRVDRRDRHGDQHGLDAQCDSGRVRAREHDPDAERRGERLDQRVAH